MMAKNLTNDENEDVPAADDAQLDPGGESAEMPAAPTAGPVPGKRALGTKEPIIFKWKLIGTSNNATLTLFKAVEREDVDAQFERTQKEAYYTNLKILEADAKVEQPVQPKGTMKSAPRTERSSKAAVPAATRAVAKRIAKSPISPKRKATPSKSALKSEVKPSKKKRSGTKSGSKRVVKKR